MTRINKKTEIIYKEQLICLLLPLLEVAGLEVSNSENFDEAFKTRLKFQKVTDWKKFRGSVDLLCDTEYAIMNAFEYQLGYLKTKNQGLGELYLRLYGILNAVYLQMSAFEEIAVLLQFSERKEIKKNFQKLNIYKLRGIAGSHTLDYFYDDEILNSSKVTNRKTSFRIVQFHLERTGKNITAIDENNIKFKFDLLEVLSEYEKIATDLLIQLIHHYVKNLIHKREFKVEIIERLNNILANLIDYSKINRNNDFQIKRDKEIRNMINNK